MVSQMALEDIEALREEGVELTPRDIIRLNAFGLKVELNHDSAEFNTLPRIAVLGDVVFHEPTIGSEIWLHSAERVFNLDEHDTFLQIRAYSLWKKTDELPDLSDKETITDEAGHLVKDLLAGYTVRQVENALMYAVTGNMSQSGERAARSKDEKDEGRRDVEDQCYEVGVMRLGVAFRIGTPNDIRNMTTSEARLLVEYTDRLQYGDGAAKNDHARRLVEYLSVLDEIRDRRRAPNENAEDTAEGGRKTWAR